MNYLLNRLISGFGSLQAYLIGRGLLSFAIMATAIASHFFGFWLLPAAAVAGIGGIVFTTFKRLGQQREYELEMLNLYRQEIALEMGRAPETLTRDDLREAAKTNDVLAQALKRQEHRTAIAIATQSLAAVVTVALFGLLGGEHMVEYLQDKAAWLTSKAWGFGAYLVGVGTVAGFTSLIVHDGLEMAIGQATGVSKAAAHDRILEMQHGLGHGVAATPQQVYGVLLAGDPQFAQEVATKFHQSYAQMKPEQQQDVLVKMGVDESMAALARQINSGVLDTGRLAYMIGELHYMRNQTVPVAAEEKTHQPVLQSFVEKLGLADRVAQSHRTQIEASRDTAVARVIG